MKKVAIFMIFISFSTFATEYTVDNSLVLHLQNSMDTFDSITAPPPPEDCVEPMPPPSSGPSDEQRNEAAGKLRGYLDGRRGAEAAAYIMENVDANDSGRLGASELSTIFEEVGLGNVFTRGRWVSGVLDEWGTGNPVSLSLANLNEMLVDVGLGS
jgi:hypothetical protein